MVRYVRIILVLIIAAFLFSCTERIDLPLDEGSIRLVVEGTITTEPGVHTVYLTKTTGYYYNQAPPVVTGASVNISDGENGFELKEEMPGVYRTSSGFHGIAGLTYTLNIILDSPIGGFTEFSAVETINKPVIIDSVGLEYYPGLGEKGLWEVKCWMQDTPSTDFYRFQLYRGKHLITHSLNKWLVTSDNFFNAGYVNGIAITYLDQGSDNEKLTEGDILTVELNIISRKFYMFIQDAQSELRGSNPLFSGPGANVRGNINNGALGFFAAYPVTRSITVVR